MQCNSVNGIRGAISTITFYFISHTYGYNAIGTVVSANVTINNKISTIMTDTKDKVALAAENANAPAVEEQEVLNEGFVNTADARSYEDIVRDIIRAATRKYKSKIKNIVVDRKALAAGEYDEDSGIPLSIVINGSLKRIRYNAETDKSELVDVNNFTISNFALNGLVKQVTEFGGAISDALLQLKKRALDYFQGAEITYVVIDHKAGETTKSFYSGKERTKVYDHDWSEVIVTDITPSGFGNMLLQHDMFNVNDNPFA